MSDCRCMAPPFHFQDFESEMIGVDESNGRFGEVSIETCKLCGSPWLRYFVEYEDQSASGRWYRGLVPRTICHTITPENAVSILQNLEWRFCGGSWFNSTGQKSQGPVLVDR